MEKRTSTFQQAMLWLLPTGSEIAIYLFITGVTFILSGVDVVRTLLFFSGDFNPIRAGIASVDTLLTHIVGEKIAGSLSLAIFWGAVGLAVNVLWWLGSNFSSELSNDLVFSKYVHPKDTDPSSQLKQFVERTVIRTTVAVIGILYFNFFIGQGLPSVSTKFNQVISGWSGDKNIGLALIGIATEILLLHIFVVLCRLILLRKQVFDR